MISKGMTDRLVSGVTFELSGRAPRLGRPAEMTFEGGLPCRFGLPAAVPSAEKSRPAEGGLLIRTVRVHNAEGIPGRP
jgi:hypothetical protein